MTAPVPADGGAAVVSIEVDGRTVRLDAGQREALKTFPAIVLRAEVERRRQQDSALQPADGGAATGGQSWLLAEFSRARARYAKVPAWYRPVVTLPLAQRPTLHEDGIDG